MGKEGKKIVANNKKAFFDYFIEERGGSITCGDGGKVPAHGQGQYQGGVYPH